MEKVDNNENNINGNELRKSFSFKKLSQTQSFLTSTKHKLGLNKSKSTIIPQELILSNNPPNEEKIKNRTLYLKRGLSKKQTVKAKEDPNNQPIIEHPQKPPSIMEKFHIDIKKIKKYTNLTLKQYKDVHKKKEPKDALAKNNSCLSLLSISTKKQENLEQNEKMHHIRSFSVHKDKIEKKTFDLYSLPSFLKNSRYSVQDPKLQIETIIDKSKLILDNMSYFKGTYMFSDSFYNAFINLNEKQKAKYNLTIEELCAVLIKLPPLLMNKFYDSLDQILYCTIPVLFEEKKKILNNETQCMKENYKLFIDVSVYFTGCIEVFKVLSKKITDLKFPRNIYCQINLLLDTARFDSSTLIAFAKAYIEKTKSDIKMLIKFEEGLELREKKVFRESNDYLERYKNRERRLNKDENKKLNRIINALDLDYKIKRRNQPMEYLGNYNKYLNQTSLLNLGIVSNMMKYIDKPIREKIIAQRVVERYKENEINMLKEIEDKN